MPAAPYDFDVFLGHASEDKPAVRTFARQLEAAGFSVWLDEERLPPGTQPTLDVPRSIERCQHLAAWISDAWLKKDYTLWELKLFHEARQAGRTVIPILHCPWDTRRLGPYLAERVAIPPNTEERARLWLTVCALRGESPGPEEHWSTQGRSILAKKKVPPRTAPPRFRLRYTSTRRDLPSTDAPEILVPEVAILDLGLHHFGRRWEAVERHADGRHTWNGASFHPLVGATHRMSRLAFTLDLDATEQRLTRPADAGELTIEGRRVPAGASRVLTPGVRIVAGGLQLEFDRA